MGTVIREQRAQNRFRLSAEIEVTSRAGWQRATLEDVSLGGARFLAGTPPGAWGDAAALVLPSTAGNGKLALTGVIVRTEQKVERYSVAVRFDPMSVGAKKRLEALTASLSSDSQRA